MASGDRVQAVVFDTDYTSFRARGFFVGTAGNASVVIGGATVTLKGLIAGVLYPLQVTKVNTAGTSAADMVLVG
jgi:hypothetical protein